MSKLNRSNSKAFPAPVDTKQRVIKPLYKMELSGKLIKLNTRSYPNRDGDKPDYTFHSGLMVVPALEPILGYLNDNGLIDDTEYLPFWTSEKEFNGEKQVSQMVQFEINGKNLQPNLWDQIQTYFEEKLDVSLELAVSVEHFKNRDGVDKKKCMFRLLPNTLDIDLGEKQEVTKPLTKKPKTVR